MNLEIEYKFKRLIEDYDWGDEPLDDSIFNLMITAFELGKIGKRITAISIDGLVIKNYACIRHAIKDGFDPKCIRRTLSGEQHQHKGFIFELTN